MVSRSANGSPQSASLKSQALLPSAEPPKAPRALIRKQVPDECLALGLELHQRLLLRHALGKYKGPYIEHQTDEFSKDSSLRELRRGFISKIAYLCDVRKEGGTVTAAALQAVKFCNFLWLAANAGVSIDICGFVKWVLHKLQKLNCHNQLAIENAILEEAIEHARPRISFYQSRLVHFARKCRQHLLNSTVEDDSVLQLLTWLEKLASIQSHDELVDTCHEARYSQSLQIKGQVKTPEDDFSELAHYIGRLGAHRQAVLVIVTAWMKVPSLRRIKEVRTLPMAQVETISIPRDSLNPYGIFKKVCKNRNLAPNKARYYLQAFTERDYFSGDDGDLQTTMERNSVLETRVHAELLIVEEFSRWKYQFVDDDKYIGCSKAACYFCYNWIVMHHKDFVMPACHNKVILGCRGPDDGLNSKGLQYYMLMLKKMISAVEQDILDYFDTPYPKGFQHQSTNGSSMAPSCILSDSSRTRS